MASSDRFPSNLFRSGAFGAALLISCGAASAQTPPAAPPSSVAPAEKIDPGPIRPDKPVPPETPAPPSSNEPGAGQTEPANPDEPKAETSDPLGVAPNVGVVRLAGRWDEGDRRGFSRVVGVDDGGKQRFFVQWLAEPDGRVVETKPLEDEDADKLTFGDVRVEASQTGVTVFMDTLPDSDGMRDTWVLIVGAPGEARFGPATN
jgi:hypothetical protein